MKGNGTYQLRKHTLRSLLTFFGPLLLLGYYVAICCIFLITPPQNQIVRKAPSSARWMYYSWFVVSTLALEWAKAALMNVEAAALMYGRFAPQTALGLLWHTDGKWANPLWWLRALRTAVELSIKKGNQTRSMSRPNWLWTSLSLTSLLITVALPLSGLTMEITNVSVYSDNKVQILGPNGTTFNKRSVMELPLRTFRYWQSGRVTTPTYGILYAPEGTPNVSLTYFDDEAGNLAPNIEVFAGPAVGEVVMGNAWGLSANISCRLIDPTELLLFNVTNPWRGQLTFTVNTCYSVQGTRCVFNNSLTNIRTEEDGDSTTPFTPLWFDDTGVTFTSMDYSHVVAADGTHLSHDGPFNRQNNHDLYTYDAASGRPLDEVTTAMLEFFLWEMPLNDFANGSEPEAYNARSTAVHCDVASAVGIANLDPRTRTYSNFTRGNATGNTIDETKHLLIYDVVPPQLIAAGALSNGVNYVDPVAQEYVYQPHLVWKSLRSALNIVTEPPDYIGGLQGLRYNGIDPMLNGSQVLLGVYKLLGESVIALMDQGGVTPWEGDLYTLKPTSYLVVGQVSWIYVLVLLSCWALLVSSSALWLMVSCRPRWAKSLDGYEMFKFGAQFTEEVNDFRSTDFRHCGNALDKIPGMVGVLPGTPDSRILSYDKGFIGLSENQARGSMTYTLDRRQAAATRIV